MKTWFAFAAVFLLGAAVGVAVGARVGAWQFVLSDAQYKAFLLVNEIQMIKKGRAENLAALKEMELNSELAKHGAYLESRLWWVLPELRSDDDSAIRGAVAYRLANPYQMPKIPHGDDAFSKQVAQGLQRNDEYLRKVLDHYRDAAAPKPAK